MATVPPRVILRMGTHAEKDYVEKTLHFFDGLILGANLVEATPGATASLMVRLCDTEARQAYYIDPMTYAFGAYVDDSGRVRSDLDWIKSGQKRGKETVRDFKRSYVGLAKALGQPFATTIERCSAVGWSDFADDATAETCCRNLAEYQYSRIAREFSTDPELQAFGDRIPHPAAIFAPYFYIEPANHEQWLNLVLRLATITAHVETRLPVHAVICIDESFLRDANFLARLERDLPGTGVAGVWLWFSRLVEDQADSPTLAALRQLVERLSARIEVYNMHGGYLSLALCKHGMSGISHGVGYGEQKQLLPAAGQSTPAVRYYLPDACKRFGVPEIQRCFTALKIHTPADFHATICDCVVCKGVVSKSVADFTAFGNLHSSRAETKRSAQTPAAVKRCRFHFLLCRIRERDWLRDASVSSISDRMDENLAKWGNQVSLSSEFQHLGRWKPIIGSS